MLPLEDTLVLDLSRILAGPFCTMTLADMGAEVIKIEEPSWGDDTRYWGPPFIKGHSTYFMSVNRNKKSITLNLKSPRGKEILTELIKKADVLVENFRPGTLENLGFGYESVHGLNPKLVYCSISGYGHTGPRRNEPGFDVVVQGESGVMSVTGLPDGPPIKMGVSIADVVAGMYGVQGILLALLARAKTGRGQKIDISLLDGMVSTLTYQAGIYFGSGKNPVRLGNRHPSLAPYEPFKASDDYVIVGAGNESLWRKFCIAIDREDLIADERFSTGAQRVENYQALKRILDPIFASKPAAVWINRLKQSDVPCGLVRSVEQALNDPQLIARDMIIKLEHPEAGDIKLVGAPIKLSETAAEIKSPPPLLGQHNEEVYTRLLGFSRQEIEALKTHSVI